MRRIHFLAVLAMLLLLAGTTGANAPTASAAEPTHAITAAMAAAPIEAPAAQGCRTFPETGFTVCGRLLGFWNSNGGLAVFGYPVGPQQQILVEGLPFQAQWFQRNRLELHPENARPNDVLLGRLGADSLTAAGIDWTTLPKGDTNSSYYFEETGHAIGSEFIAYWEEHGLEFDGHAGPYHSYEESLALFGLPLSEAFYDEARGLTIQHFERARFEHHPENAGTEYEVLLGLLGNELKPTQ